MAYESREHEDESVCCQGALLPVNAGMVMMRPTAGALRVARRCRERVLAGPCWGQAAMHWALFELCGGVSCGVLDPKLFASAAPLRQALKPHAAQAQAAMRGAENGAGVCGEPGVRWGGT
ncbi:unnamed protein product [Effrenium voratum]|nr:unnamed protein product [Effrenium voratum]